MRKKGWYWPWAIFVSTLGIIWLSVYTVMVALDNPVQLSNDHIDNYKRVDKGMNDILEANIAFSKKYEIRYLTKALTPKGALVQYRLTDKAGKGVENAQFEVLLTRPDEVNSDIRLKLDSAENGVYSFKPVDLPFEGRWNLFANVTVGEEHGFLDLRLDTRYPKEIFPYGTVFPMN